MILEEIRIQISRSSPKSISAPNRNEILYAGTQKTGSVVEVARKESGSEYMDYTDITFSIKKPTWIMTVDNSMIFGTEDEITRPGQKYFRISPQGVKEKKHEDILSL